MKSIKYIFYTLFLLIIVGLAGYFGYRFSFLQKHSEIKEEVLLEKVQNVIQLGTVEGVFSEIFQYSDHYNYDISPFRKKALIKIRAKVLVGYDLDSIDIKVEYFTQSVRIENIPDPRILSIDHELEYYDITEGTFNSFSKDDYNMLQRQSKEFIRAKVLESKLFDRSDEQLAEHFKTLNWLLEDSGWEVKIMRGDRGFLPD